jgi:hypothetical protein
MRGTFAALCLAAFAAVGCEAQGPPSVGAAPAAAVQPADVEPSDAAIEKAVAKAVAYLWSQQGKQGNWLAQGRHIDAPTALAIHALFEARERVMAPRFERALGWLKANQTELTYCRALRCLAWASAAWGSPEYRTDLRKDYVHLIRSVAPDGRAGKAKGDDEARRGANFHTFWSFRGVLAADQRHEEIPRAYWRLTLEYWTKAQNADGGWGYAPGGESNLPMTAAGLSAVHACAEELFRDRYVKVGRNQPLMPVVLARAWLDENFAAFLKGAHRGDEDVLGCLFYLQQPASLSGRWDLGKLDLYRTGAAVLLKS